MPPDEIPTPSRSDLKLWEQALRNDWPIPAAVKKRLLQIAINLADPADEEAIPRKIAPQPSAPAEPAVDEVAEWSPEDKDDEAGGLESPPEPAPGPADAGPGEAYDLADAIALGVKRDRVKLAALRIVAQFSRLNIEQQRLDLIRARQERQWALEDAARSATDEAGGVPPARAEAALKVLNEPDGEPDTHAHA